MTDTYRTPPESAVNDYDLFTLPSGKRVTVCPLGDERTTLRARLTRVDAVEALARHGLRLPSLETVKEIARVGHRIEPVTLVYNAATAAKMRTRAFCEKHDDEVTRRLLASGWDGATVVMNFGKWHIAGAAPGNNRLAGWSDRSGRFIQAGTSDNHIGEAASLFDYGTLTIGEVDDESNGRILPPRPLGERALDVAREEERAGVRETPGPRSNPRVSAYHACTVRGGRPTGLRDDALAWCASAASWCLQQALQPGEVKPHDFRAAVRELVEDARERGTWRERDWRPFPGDLAIFSRAGGDPTKGGTGHVSRVVRVDGESVELLGANESDAWRYSTIQRSEPSLRGWIRYPR